MELQNQKLEYGDKLILMEGVVVEIKDGCVGMDLKGRLGYMKVPMRMLISNYELKLGQEVGFMMSYPEVLNDGDNEHYVSNLQKLQKEGRKE